MPDNMHHSCQPQNSSFQRLARHNAPQSVVLVRANSRIMSVCSDKMRQYVGVKALVWRRKQGGTGYAYVLACSRRWAACESGATDMDDFGNEITLWSDLAAMRQNCISLCAYGFCGADLSQWRWWNCCCVEA